MSSFMKNEILSEPEVLKHTISVNMDVVKKIAEEVRARGIQNIATVARGSSDNASLCFKYAVEIFAGLPCMLFHPSIITMYKSEVKMKNNLMVAVSQSGKSIDTLAVLNNSRKTGALTVAVTNDPNSPLAKAAHYHLNLSCGEENAVTATKTFAAELVCLYMLAIAISDKKLMPTIDAIPEKLAPLVEHYDEIKELAAQLACDENTIVLSRGLMQGVGKEISLKYLECCYNLSHFFSVTDFMHGPLAIVDDKTNFLILAPDSEFTDNYIDIVTRINLLGAKVTAISDIPDVLDIASFSIKMPKADMLTASLLYAFIGHLLIMEISVKKGLNPDCPRNLKKVTITK